MAPKKTNIKIKHSKINLFNKKKSKAQRVMKVIITIIIVCALGVLGYGLGKPLINYLSNREANSSEAEGETSALISSIMNMSSEGIPENSGGSESAAGSSPTDSSAEASNGTDTSAPNVTGGVKMFYLDDNAALNESNLDSAIAAAKASGCSAAAVTLKDTDGFLLYKTDIAKVKDTDTVKSELSAAQIAQKISAAGLTPAARINTLTDQTGAIYIEGYYELNGGGCWLDNRRENGGKAWMSPFKSVSAEYIGNITEELAKSGFKHIVCANTRFPAFHPVDITSYLSNLPLKDNAARADALWSVLDAAKAKASANGAELWIEISASGLTAESKSNTDAELTEKRDKLADIKITVNFNLELKDDNANTITSDFITKAKAALGKDYSVRMSASGSQSASEQARKQLEDARITVY